MQKKFDEEKLSKERLGMDVIRDHLVLTQNFSKNGHFLPPY